MIVNVLMLSNQPEVQVYPLEINLTKSEQDSFVQHLFGTPNQSIIDQILDKVFEAGNRCDRIHGQLFCSVSVGDVALLGNGRYMCSPIGWRSLTVEELAKYCETTREERVILGWGF